MSEIHNSEDLELFHFGVKGMKWGVRRPEGSDGRVSKSPGIRQKLKARDESIKSARKGGVKDAVKKDAAAQVAYNISKASRRRGGSSDVQAKRREAKAAHKELLKTRKRSRQLTTKETLAVGAIYFAPAIIGTGALTAGTIGTRRNAAIGKKVTADMFADTKGLNPPGTVALNLINGVWQ